MSSEWSNPNIIVGLANGKTFNGPGYNWDINTADGGYASSLCYVTPGKTFRLINYFPIDMNFSNFMLFKGGGDRDVSYYFK